MSRLTCVIGASLATVSMAVAFAGTADGALIERLETLSGPDVVMIAGDIVPGDDLEFLSEIQGVESAVVLFRGPGGDPVAAMNIGTLIAERNFATAIVPGSRCASGCALAWLAGNTRYMAPDARIGLIMDDTPTEAAPSTAALGRLVRNYLRDLKLSALLPAIAYQAGEPASDSWMTRATATSAGIEVAISEYEDKTTAITGSSEMAATKPAAAAEPATGTAAPPPDASEMDATETEAPETDGPEESDLAATSDTAPAGMPEETGGQVVLALPSDMRWLVLQSARDESTLTRDGYDLPQDIDLIRVRTRNGMYASAIGPFPLAQVDQTRRDLIRGGAIPGDSYISTGNGFVEQVD